MQTEIRFNYDDVLIAKDKEGKKYYVGIYPDDFCVDWSQDEDPLGHLVTWHRRYSIGEKHDYEDPEDFWKSLIKDHYGYSLNAPNEETKKRIPEFCRLILDYSEAIIEEEVDEEDSTKSYYLFYNGNGSAPQCEYELSTNVPDKFNNDDESYFWDVLECLTEEELRDIVDHIPDIIYFNVYMYEHSGIALSLSNSVYPFNDRWDAGQLGFWSCSKKELEKFCGHTVDNWETEAKNIIQSRIDEVNEIECGNVWGFASAPVEEFEDNRSFKELRDDVLYAHDDSCWGFIGNYDDRVKDYCSERNLEIIGVVED